MREVTISTSYHRITYRFIDDAQAQAAYEIAKKALQDKHDRTNDRMDYISFAHMDGEATFSSLSISEVCLGAGEESQKAFLHEQLRLDKEAHETAKEYGFGESGKKNG